MILEDLASWIAVATTKGAVPVITGRNGDMDTIGSAIALASSHPNLMACGLHLGKLANRLCTELNAPFANYPSLLLGQLSWWNNNCRCCI
ncbi:MAG: hypothetical protein CM15mP1_1750 [Methanobacteriota archaeon]|nr:MAG: hypothetical protein CM15mP1_1750 [Euryarchaeota archaeon]